jgi:imidazolonepropionase-like amidohydrolase
VSRTAPSFVVCDEAWVDGWVGPSAFEVRNDRLAYVGAAGSVDASASLIRVPGTILPGFRDSHVHLGLIDGAALVTGGISRVLDLGWDPDLAASWKKDAGDLEVDIVGALLTAPGGYPSTSSWAPRSASRFVANADDAAAAVADMRTIGASMIKIALNSEAGPVWSDDLLAVVVAAAHEAGLSVVAHAQGAGQAVRAVAAGVDALAHTPWTERVSEADLAAMATRCTWLSTLDIHGWGNYGDAYGIALDNLRRFIAAGGRVLYGTDLGNGPLPVGLNRRELDGLVSAGLGLDQLVTALTPGSPAPSGERFTWTAEAPTGAQDAAQWLASATVTPVTDLAGFAD